MSEALLWTCPFCNRHATITSDRQAFGTADLKIKNADGYRRLVAEYVVCPNPKCKRFTLTVSLFLAHDVIQREGFTPQFTDVSSTPLFTQRLIPKSSAKPMPDYIPPALRNDYEEACTIRDLSPKAAATLCRRCLQGMIRDFWGIVKARLVDEIDALKDKLDSDTWNAIDSLRKVGNIGAHMEQDVNLVIETVSHL
jgi:hypothetical protein